MARLRFTCDGSFRGTWLHPVLCSGAFDGMFSLLGCRRVRCLGYFLHVVSGSTPASWAIWRPLLAAGIRFGEALHPGPMRGGGQKIENEVVTFVTPNPTALNEKVSVFRELIQVTRAHFVAASETSATECVQRRFAAGMRRCKWRSCFSSPAPPQRGRCDGEDSLRGRAVGTAAFSCLPVRFCKEELAPSWRDSLRIIHVIVSLGVISLQVFVLYGLVAPTQGYASYNNQLLETAVDASRHLPLPAVFMGDFNIDVHKLPSFRALQHRGHASLQQCFSERFGGEMPPTCKDSTRPDTAILPPEVLPWLQNIEVHSDGRWFDSHHPVSFSLRIPGQQVHRLLLPLPKPLTDFWFGASDIEDVWSEVDPGRPPASFEEWAGWMEDAFDVALRKVPCHLGLPKALPAAHRGRCRERKKSAAQTTTGSHSYESTR